MRLCFLWWSMMLAVLAIPAAAQSDGEWVVTEAKSLVELVGEERPQMPILSPDGTAIAYEQRGQGACIYRFADDAAECFPWPEDSDLSTGRFNQPVWSADSRYIAYTADLFQLLLDSDIWTLDVQSGEFTNWTDDGFQGSFFREPVEESPPLDYLPLWNPATDELYFFRTDRAASAAGDVSSTELYKIDASGEPVLVRDMTKIVPGPMAVYLPAAFSADGTRLAFIALLPGLQAGDGSGVWVLDLTSGALEQVADMPALSVSLPAWFERLMTPNTIHWVDDNLIVLTTDPLARGGPLNIPYYLDLDTGDVTPLVDYSEFETEKALNDYRKDGVSPFSTLVQGVPAEDGSAYFALTIAPQTGQAGLYAFALPPATGAPQLLATVELAPQPGAEARPVLADDGRTLLHTTVFQIEREP